MPNEKPKSLVAIALFIESELQKELKTIGINSGNSPEDFIYGFRAGFYAAKMRDIEEMIEWKS
ncbi:hypothetical protein UFOVP1357_33 [uncultured Caudovirales phage]|uniref:Phage protein n=1 Tax=uncultured Caudovirales phage TaxID=2100421 RepID=A0A6J5LES1_9CAUD|nr:hypothetical protein UFOVP18_39 [uncultured Caudovirales phage]CAB4126983.1 hypothetical protein UFOVP82_41 [uncultured Caudovirales phage]CAB4132545.1 hypothetical protein UFOVP258_32 [uncultured Caudovirales phage]CAB4146451.1 hypothetical protein UFOVP502_24 [uncultured Caudovirales phage]CAB4200187.1 hypothetical protein UFOVP1357_33 [uncultured Caudovirales phage]